MTSAPRPILNKYENDDTLCLMFAIIGYHRHGPSIAATRKTIVVLFFLQLVIAYMSTFKAIAVASRSVLVLCARSSVAGSAPRADDVADAGMKRWELELYFRA